MSIYKGTQLISGVATPVQGARNIGQIIPSTIPLTDAGLHLLDGALIQGSGIYSAFVTYIAGLVTDYPNLFCTEANWQASVAQYGFCDKYVYDSVNNAVRLPKIGNQLIHNLPSTLGVKGNGITLGLTDGTSLTGLCANNSSNTPFLVANTGGSYGSAVGSTPSAGALKNGKSIGITTDSTKSGLIAETNNINTADVYYYIVIATSTKTAIQVDIDEIATDLNGKADVDLTNVNNAGTSKGAGWAMPSDTYDELTLGANGSEYIAPANGYFRLNKKSNAANQQISLQSNNVTLGVNIYSNSSGNNLDSFIPVKKGDKITVYYTTGGTTNVFRFIYAKGSESEAS